MHIIFNFIELNLKEKGNKKEKEMGKTRKGLNIFLVS